jgi:hypothetical protein
MFVAFEGEPETDLLVWWRTHVSIFPTIDQLTRAIQTISGSDPEFYTNKWPQNRNFKKLGLKPWRWGRNCSLVSRSTTVGCRASFASLFIRRPLQLLDDRKLYTISDWGVPTFSRPTTTISSTLIHLGNVKIKLPIFWNICWKAWRVDWTVGL